MHDVHLEWFDVPPVMRELQFEIQKTDRLQVNITILSLKTLIIVQNFPEGVEKLCCLVGNITKKLKYKVKKSSFRKNFLTINSDCGIRGFEGIKHGYL